MNEFKPVKQEKTVISIRLDVDMLKNIDEFEAAQKIEKALFKTIKEGKILTQDLGGSAKTTEFRDEIIKNL